MHAGRVHIGQNQYLKDGWGRWSRQPVLPWIRVGQAAVRRSRRASRPGSKSGTMYGTSTCTSDSTYTVNPATSECVHC